MGDTESTTRGQGLARMTAFTQAQPTATLCAALLELDAKTSRTPEERLARGVIIDVLCARHPEADAAFTAWAEDDSAPPQAAARMIAEAAGKAAAK